MIEIKHSNEGVRDKVGETSQEQSKVTKRWKTKEKR